MHGAESEFIRQEEIAALRRGATQRFDKWRQSETDASFEDIPRDSWAVFIPNEAYQISLNPENVEARSVNNSQNKIQLAVLEKNYPHILTNPEDWEVWTNFEETKQPGEAPPESFSQLQIDPLHREYSWMIKEGMVTLNDRIMLTADMYTVDHGAQVLRVGDYNGLKGKGLGKEYYQSTLPLVASKMNVRYIVGENNENNIGFFTDSITGLGRATIDQIKPEYRAKFFPHEHDLDTAAHPFHTVQFLYEEDKEKYLL